MLCRYVHGPGSDKPIIWYQGSGTSHRRLLTADKGGNVTAITNSAGSTIAVNIYDEYGIPAPTNIGWFQYTGQAWLPEICMYFYKARIYSPTLGRIMQTDPIGYGDGMNWSNYVGGRFVDPTGLFGSGSNDVEMARDRVGPNGRTERFVCINGQCVWRIIDSGHLDPNTIIGGGAGIINARAGGGSILTLGILSLTGLDPRIANLTSTVALSLGQIAAGFSVRSRVNADFGA